MEFKLRPMEEKDLKVTHEWRNDKEVLRNAMTTHPVSFNEHEALFRFNNALKLVFEVNSEPAGFVTCTRDPDEPVGEWGFHMNPSFRGKGLSEIMLRMALYYLKNEEGYVGITSAVQLHNKISQHLHDKLGFEQTGSKNNFKEYYRDL